MALSAIPESIGQLSDLRELNLNRNQIINLQAAIAGLSQLERLNLRGNRIAEVPDSIAQLSQLRLLDLGSNRLAAISDAITELSQLEALSLDNNQITAIPDSIAKLYRLRELGLWSNQIKIVPESVSNLSYLRELNLGGNRLGIVPNPILQLGQLQRLYLWENGIGTIPDSITQLSQLRMLNLGRNGISSIPDSLAQLLDLEELYLWSNQIRAIPDFLAQISMLQRLDLRDNEIAVIPDSIAKLSRLQQLDLGNNRIKAGPDSFAQLSQLQRLDLGHNEITAVSQSLAQLAELETLDLSGNRITAIPEQFSQLAKLKNLFLHGNPGLGIPEEILGPTARAVYSLGKEPKPPQEILAYIRKAGDSRPLNEAKLILVGQGHVGKTSLVKALTTGKFKKGEKTTQGIKISDWECPLNRKDKATVHIWDFGGQEMMHATHQFFLTQRSLYLLVLNRRQGGADREADYWFRLVRAFGGKDAPVIVVLNKQKSEPFEVNREGWLEKYRGNIKGFVRTDCEDRKSITQLKRRIVEELQAMQSLKVRFPRRWFAIKDALSQMAAEHISFEQYRKLCQQHDESDTAGQTSLAGFLHDLGIALNYRQDPRLRFNYVLKPEWVTQGIYALLHAFVRKKGVFTHAEAESELAKRKYSAEETQFILGLMERFELSFSLGEKRNRVLIPELLEDQQPKDAADFKPAECLNFGYKYPVLPEGLLPRFIARTHHLGRPETRWKSGVILEDSSTDCRALVRAHTPEAEVRVHIAGPEEARRELLGIIRYNFEVIHSDYEFKPEARVYPPVAPQKALSVDELEALARSKATTVTVVLPDKTIINQDIAALMDPLARPAPLKLFMSYSHLEESSINELRKDLKLMEMNGQILPWYDRALTPGDQWEPSILQEIRTADIVVCQLSRNYLASDNCVAELKAAMDRNQAGEAALAAYVLTDSGWREFPGLAILQVLPTDGKPLSDWPDSNKYWRSVIEGIQRAIKKHQAERKARPELLKKAQGASG